MSIKKLLLSALLLTTTGFAYAQQTTTDNIKIEDCIGDNAIIAGVDDRTKGIIKINLNNNPDNKWCAFQFDLHLPEGVEIGKYKNPRGNLVPDYAHTNRLTDEEVKPFSYEMNEISKGVYRFIAYNNRNDQIWVNDDPTDLSIFTVRLIATDQAKTGTFEGWIDGAILSDSHEEGQGAQVIGANCPKTESKFTIQINAKIGAGGYGSFSWPRDVVFSDVNVYVATSETTDKLHLEPITSKIIPAKTGVFLQGDEGIVNPKTLDDVDVIVTMNDMTDDDKSFVTSNILDATWDEPLEVKVDGIYALATKNKITALYPIANYFDDDDDETEVVVIPKYKAYLSSTIGAKYFSFSDTATSIDALDMTEEEGDIYTLGGQKVQKTTMKGVYIKNGKKVVVK